MPSPARAPLRLTAGAAAGLALFAFGALALFETRALPIGTLRQPGPAAFPAVLAMALMGFGALLVAFSGRSTGLRQIGWEELRQAVLILLGAGAAIFLLLRLGYVVTMAALLLYLLAVVARRHWAVSILAAAGLSAGTFALFDLALRVPLPRSPFGTFF